VADERKALDVLVSIEALLKQIVAWHAATAPKPVASDRDLDGKYGDPELKFVPRDWTGDNFKGSRFSECPAELLDLVAETFDYFASQAEAKNELTTGGKAVAPYKRADAARARGWAKRKREGYVVPAPAQPKDEEISAEAGWADRGGFEKPDDEVPF
jgi:hypothetical protein